MKAFRIVVSAALLFASAPAFAHGGGGGGMGGMGHGNGMTTTPQNQHMSGTTTGMGKTTNGNIVKSIELHRVFEKDLKVEREIVALMNRGLGNSLRALALKALDIKLAMKLRQLGFTGT
jgi:hypothetical protein